MSDAALTHEELEALAYQCDHDLPPSLGEYRRLIAQARRALSQGTDDATLDEDAAWGIQWLAAKRDGLLTDADVDESEGDLDEARRWREVAAKLERSVAALRRLASRRRPTDGPTATNAVPSSQDHALVVAIMVEAGFPEAVADIFARINSRDAKAVRLALQRAVSVPTDGPTDTGLRSAVDEFLSVAHRVEREYPPYAEAVAALRAARNGQ